MELFCLLKCVGDINMPAILTKDTLPDAVRSLFTLNNYDVYGPLQVHGAEVDLQAQLRSDPFAQPIYMEVTVEYVNNDKYGKDVGKLALLREKQPEARLLIISSQGFSLPVQERAKNSRFELLTYDELFSKFQRFGPYVDRVLAKGSLAEELVKLDAIYEEPQFVDSYGSVEATKFLDQWRMEDIEDKRWLIIVGEYGTGKTALTKILLKRWMQEYQHNTLLPMPFRIELRDFTRQFDARSLLHHFLDTNGLGHLPLDFLSSLISTGRVVLLLDGYDEMAQYMHARERRVCLQALAELAKGGAKGILTSRPSYFTEAEELQIIDHLYRSIENRRQLSKRTETLLEGERTIDALLQSQFLSRYERSLQDLSSNQTEALVHRVLAHDVVARDVVLGILRRVFRSVDAGGDIRSLSGKPVIITYILELAEEFKDGDRQVTGEPLSEWQIYELIVQKLMERDFRRSDLLLPEQRLAFLEQLSVWLSKKGNAQISEEDFLTRIRKGFEQDLRRRLPDEREEETQRLFSDLRSSATLARTNNSTGNGWRFSHNSLREFLLARYILNKLEQGTVGAEMFTVTDAMRIFTASRSSDDMHHSLEKLGERWSSRSGNAGISAAFCLLWDAITKLFDNTADPARTALELVAGPGLGCDEISLERIQISSLERPANLNSANFSHTTLTSVGFAAADCQLVNFTESILDGVSFAEANLRRANFYGCIISDVDISAAEVTDADFRGIDEKARIIYGQNIYEGTTAKGFLAFLGAITDAVPPIYKYQHYQMFAIAQKVAGKLLEGGLRQILGLTQRGAARANPAFAREFIQMLVRENFARIPAGRDTLIEITDVGRKVLTDMERMQELHPALQELLDKWR